MKEFEIINGNWLKSDQDGNIKMIKISSIVELHVGKVDYKNYKYVIDFFSNGDSRFRLAYENMTDFDTAYIYFENLLSHYE
jgi:hypothetical protein